MKRNGILSFLLPVSGLAAAVMVAVCVLAALAWNTASGWIVMMVLLGVLLTLWAVHLHALIRQFAAIEQEKVRQAAADKSRDADTRNTLLVGLIHEETLNNEGYQAALEAEHIILDQPYFAAAILALPEEQEEAEPAAPLLSLCEPLSELASRVLYPAVAYAMVTDGMMVLLINTSDPDALPRQLERLVDAVQRQMNLRISVALGHEVYHAREFRTAYRTALIAYEKLLTEEEPQALCQEPLTLSGGSSVAFFNELHLMLGYLIDNEFVAASQVSARVFEVFLAEKKPYHTVVDDRMTMFRSCFQQAVEAAITNDAAAIDGYLACRSGMDKPMDLQEIQGIYLNMAQLAEEAVARRRKTQSGPAVRIRSYIDQNYTDPMLDLTLLSEQLELSPSYISRMFKSAFGQTVLTYITGKRIDRARELLRDTDATLEEIAAKVGYNSAATFSRAFQKVCAVPPNQYRRTDRA